METRGCFLRLRAGILLLYLTLAAISLTQCESMRLSKGHKQRRNLINKHPNKLKMIKHFDVDPSLESSNAQPYSISSPNSLPPYESLAPIPLPDNSPPFCVYPPNPPSTSIPTPGGYASSPPPYLPIENPPPSPTGSIPGPPESYPTPTPEIIPSPPESYPTPTPEIIPSPPSNIPGSPEPGQNPPVIFPSPPESTTTPPYYEPSPPYYIPSPTGGVVPSPSGPVPSPGGGGGIIPSPPSFVPSPTGGGGILPSPPTFVPSPTGGTVPSPTVFQPPVIFPPPSVPPPPNTSPSIALWCVAKPSVPDPIIQEAMSYACGSGADCDSIQPNGPCFEPNSVYAHASYAFNSYWQRTKVNRGSCDFGGTAMLVSVDPSYDGCHFDYY